MQDSYLKDHTAAFEATPLDERKQHILKAVVADYVLTAEPVGSKALLQRHALNYSSATIRNEMAELEELGYLEKPHTSSGRIPSDKGYRLYVDTLLQPSPLSLNEQQLIREELNAAFDNLTHLLSEAAHYLSGKTGYTSILLAPTSAQACIKHLRMLKTEPGKVLIILVMNAGVVHNRLIRISDLLTEEQLRSVAQAVETSVNSMPLSQIDLLTIEQARPDIEIEPLLLDQLIYEAWLAIRQADAKRAYVQGMPNLLQYPEFHDPNKAKQLFGLLSDEKELCSLIPEHMLKAKRRSFIQKGADGSSFTVSIGQELCDAAFSDCSLVSSTYSLANGTQIGQINVIGPKRMAYEQVISQVSFVSTTLNELLSEYQQRHEKDN